MIGSKKTSGLLLLCLLAFSLRVGATFALPAAPVEISPGMPGQIAENLLAGQGFSSEFLGVVGPTSQEAPFYPLLLTVAWWCFGVATPTAILAVQLLQCVAGTVLVLAVAWLGWSLMPDRPGIGWVAAIGAAIYPTHVLMVTHLNAVVWTALVLTLLLAICVAPGWRATRRGAIFAGCLAGLLLLIEPILALALPICALAFWMAEADVTWMGHFSRGAAKRVAIMATIAVLMIAPWLVRNWAVHGEPVFIKSNFGHVLWQANNRISWGTNKIPRASAERLHGQHDTRLAGIARGRWEARHETLSIDDVLLEPDGYQEFVGLSEPQRSRLLRRRATEFIRTNPGSYAKLCMQRLHYFLLFDETNPTATDRLYRIATVAWLVLAWMGLSISWPSWRSLWPTYAIAAIVTLFHTLVIVSVRFRIPIEPMTFLWGSIVVTPLVNRLWARRRLKIYRPGEHWGTSEDEGATLPAPHFDIAAKHRAAARPSAPLPSGRRRAG